MPEAYTHPCGSLGSSRARKLRQFCKEHQIRGYSTVYNRKKLDGLVNFLIAQQVTSAQVVEFVEMLA
ncbi:MAG: hypothetical protein ACYTXY_35745 [Nostoc sp.]